MRLSSKGIRFRGSIGFPASTTPATTVPACSSSISAQALLIASIALAGSSPFSKKPEASVRSPIRLALFRILAP